MRAMRIVAAAALAGALALGCNGATSIEDLLQDPSQYDGRTVRIQGTVEEAVGALGYGGYRIDDGTGKILVVTNTGGAPRTGARVGVEGEFRSAFTLGTHTVAAVIEKERKTR